MSEKIQPTSGEQITGSSFVEQESPSDVQTTGETNWPSAFVEIAKVNERFNEKIVGSLFEKTNTRIEELNERITELEKRKKWEKFREVVYILLASASVALTFIFHFWK